MAGFDKDHVAGVVATVGFPLSLVRWGLRATREAAVEVLHHGVMAVVAEDGSVVHGERWFSGFGD